MSVERFKTVAPLLDLRMDRGESFQLTPDASIAPVPDWLRNDKVGLDGFSRIDRSEIDACTHCFICGFDVDEEAEMLARRGRRGKKKEDNPRSAKGVAADLVYLANLAFWLQRTPHVGFNYVYQVRDGSEAFYTMGPARHDRFLYHPNDESQRRRITSDDLKAVQKLYVALATIPRDSAPWTAFRAVTSALQMQRNEIRHLLLWIALEALFGADTEITYRISQRLAFFLASDRGEAAELFVKAKQGYVARCKMAHGAWGPKTANTPENLEVTGITEDFVRRAFIHLLRNDETIKIFCGKEEKRGVYLDHLPFEEFTGQPGSIPNPAQSPKNTDGE